MSFNPEAFDEAAFDPAAFEMGEETPVPATFVGPAISNLTLLINEAMSLRNYSGLFTATEALTFAIVGVLPTGLSLSVDGVLSGTPTVEELVTSLEVEADDGTVQALSNSFSINVVLELAEENIVQSPISTIVRKMAFSLKDMTREM